MKTAKHTLFMKCKNVNINRESSVKLNNILLQKIFNDTIKKYSKDNEEEGDINIKLSGIQQEYTYKNIH